MIAIQVIDENDSLSEVTLDGVVFFIHLAWNDEGGFWMIGLQNANQQTLIEGIALVPDYPVLERYRTPDMPAGILMALAPDRRDTISRTDLPTGTVILAYISAEEVAARAVD